MTPRQPHGGGGNPRPGRDACWPRPSWNSSSPYVAYKQFVYRPSSHHKGRSARSRSPDINPLTSLPPPGIIRVASRGLTPQGPPCLLLFTPFSREGNQCNGNAAQLQELTQIQPCNGYDRCRVPAMPMEQPVSRPGNELPLCSGTACHSVPKLVSYADVTDVTLFRYKKLLRSYEECAIRSVVRRFPTRRNLRNRPVSLKIDLTLKRSPKSSPEAIRRTTHGVRLQSPAL